jgi:8-oxo-dGTP diphosphatase
VPWVRCDAGHRHWGPYGAAGLLIRCGDAYLLQLRAAWTHHGGTWGIPGGARHQGEGSYAAACREAAEEMGPLPSLTPLEAFTDDHGGWAYVTYLVAAAGRFEPHGSAETAAHAWVTRGEMAAMTLHPGLAASPAIIEALTQSTSAHTRRARDQ